MKKVRKLICVLSCLALFMTAPLSVFADDVSETEPLNNTELTGEGTADSPYIISTADELKAFAQKANGGERTAYATLAADIDLNPGIIFNADGTYSGGEPEQWTTIEDFTGVFDGGQHYIKGLYINRPDEDNQGLFGDVACTVTNLGIENSYVCGAEYVGSICARNGKGGVIELCYNSGTVEGSRNVGGIAGYAFDITACANDGNVTADVNAAGGIAGTSQGNVTLCYNTGAVYAGNDAAGGVLGSSRGNVEKCFNTGNVSSGGGAWDSIGGVIGAISTYSASAVIENCYNLGTVNGANQYAGGIVGSLGRKCHVVNNFNMGGLTGGAQFGNIAGSISSAASVDNSYYLFEEETADGGKTAEQFASGEVAYLLNTDEAELVWKQNIDNGEGNPGYPSFSGGDVYMINKYATCDKSDTPTIGYSNTDADIAGAHDLIRHEGTPAECTKDGNIEYWQCAACGKYFSDEAAANEITQEMTVIPMSGHSLVKTEAKEATCTEAGNTEYWQCAVCGKYFSDENASNEITADDTVIDALGHTPEIKGVKEASCTQEGYTGDKVCSVCGETLEKGTTVEKLAHNFKDGKCTVCGAKDPNYVPKEPEKPTKPEQSTKPVQAGNAPKPNADNGNVTSAPTGDESNVLGWAVVIAIASAGAAAAVAGRKHKK